MSSPPQHDPRDERPLLPVEWLDLVGGVAGAEPVPPGAGEARAESLAALERARRHALALAALPALDAPPALDGRVVASLHAGARQERAVEQLRSLTALKAPAILDEAVAAKVRGVDAAKADIVRAPGVLDRLVAEHLADPEKALARSMADRLGRRSAPEELDRRVAERLLTDLGTSRRSSRTRVAAAVGAALLAVVLVLALRGVGAAESRSGGAVAATPGSGSSAPRVVSLEIQRVDREDLTDVERAFLGMVGGPL